MKLEQVFEECKKQKQAVPKRFDKMVIKCSWIVNKQYHQLKLLKRFIVEHIGV